MLRPARYAIVLSVLSACGGVATTTPTEPAPRCHVEQGPNDVTFVQDPQLGYGFSLPPPAAWTVECVEEDNRVLRASNEQIDAAVAISADPATTELADPAYLRQYVRETRGQLQERGMEVSSPRMETLEGTPIGVLEIRTREEGEVSLHVAAFSILRTQSGGFLRFMVILPSEGRFGHRDDDPMVRRAMRTALSFGSLE